MTPIIAVITDFGLADPYAGIMKGVIRSLGSDSDIVDITHDIKQGDIKAASFALHMAYDFFPASTIFLAVVDPSVGTARRPIAVEADGKFVVCPDNGIISDVSYRYQSMNSVQITNEDCFLGDISSTFHGRDVFAPTAARLSMGMKLCEIGPKINDLKIFEKPAIQIGGHHIEGEVVYIDGYGNLITNISHDIIDDWLSDASLSQLRVHIGAIEITGVSRTYADADRSATLALFGSTGALEIAVSGGSAASLIGNKIGAKVLVYK